MSQFDFTRDNIDDEIDKIKEESFGVEYEVLLEDEQQTEVPFDAEKIRIEQRMLSLKYMKELIDLDLLNLYPDFQRNKVWKEIKRKSLLIESLMLRIPIPAFYFYEDEDSVLHVIDGLQRLSTINEFLNGDFKLKGLQYLQDSCDGKSFKDLDAKYVSRIYMTQLAVNVIDARTPSQVKYDLFRRINTGGVSLNAQEIRNSIAKPRIRDFLKKLAHSNSFLKATDGGVNDTRMAAQELVLRFIAFYLAYNYDTNELEYHKSDLELFLDRGFEKLNSMNESKLTEIEKAFTQAMNNASGIFGEYAFRKYKSSELNEPVRRKLINKSLFTSWSVLLAEPGLKVTINEFASKNAVYTLANLIETNEDYSNALTIGTNAAPRVDMNFNLTRHCWEELRLDFQ
ncbi:DUF262 domain-containing protein [Bacillus sp. S3]|uniref:DUF262 domain-containing protein n=1 Tax=Bacillus sp. S3 TaxID=486398 RepID=UPI00118B825D|nr:DUF262 domain-containing protein [Bacillus sp. S3]QCJ44717.1 DUF262 domain-containing protein [Bacillus sp. S3]